MGQIAIYHKCGFVVLSRPDSLAAYSGDGGTASGATPAHTYDSAGSYTATVTVSDGNGGSDSATITILVSDPGSGNLVAYEGFA